MRTLVPMLEHHITGSQAWTGETVAPSDWTMPLPDECVAELRAALAQMARYPLPTFLLSPDEFELDACREFMAGIRRRLHEGPMFAVVDRLPLAEMSRREAMDLYWLLATLVARPVAQKFDGTMFYGVLDTGATLKPGSGIRPTVTNVDLTFHNDNSYNTTPPHYVALLCLSRSKEGGQSRVISVYSVHNVLLAEYPDVLPRLYRPFWYDRHTEHAKEDVPYSSAPIFEYDGRTLHARIALREIYAGYELRGEEMDEETRVALETVQTVFDRPGLHAELDFQPGQIQLVNNRSTGHARTAFVDGDSPDEKRHLIRLWLRDTGRRGYAG